MAPTAAANPVLRLHNTLTKRVEEFVARDPSHVTFYSCGPTVYDDAHIGNFRSFLAADVLRRFLESPLCSVKDAAGAVHPGPRLVTHVMNITDVGHMTDDAEGGESGEDRMAVAGRRLLEAKKAGTLPAGVEVNPGDPYQIARFYEARFKEDARNLGLKVALEAKGDHTLMPKATDNIPGMIAVISRLLDRDYAYKVDEPGNAAVYFDVSKFKAYGDLSGNKLDALKEGEGGRVQATHQSQKRNPADFLLWKEDSAHLMKWESPWGTGYPGWHIECTAMSVSRLVPWSRHMNKQQLVEQLRAEIHRMNIGRDSLVGIYGATVATLNRDLGITSKPAKNKRFSDAHYIAALILDNDRGKVDGDDPLYSIIPKRKSVSTWLKSPSANIAIWSIIRRAGVPIDGESLIDVHSGGEDNIFPHHECEIAQSCCAFNSPSFARMWFHPRFLLVEGTKMSKSKGNFFTARDLFAKGVQAGALRLELIRTHYRANANFTMQGLEDCQRMIDRWRRVVDAHPAEGAGAAAADAAALREHPLCREVAMALSEDLNVAQAVAAVNAWLNGLGAPTRADADALRVVDGVLGVLGLAQAKAVQTEIGVFAPGVTPDAKVEELLRARRDARAKKDFAASDKIRDELAAMGFAIKDMAGGKVEVRRG